MAMERRSSVPYSNGGGMSYGGGGGGGYDDEPYQMKRYKAGKSMKVWGMGMQDPETKRKKRVASYKVYTVEGKVKTSVRSGFRWIKRKYIDLRYGWW